MSEDKFVTRPNGFVKGDGGKVRMELLPWDALEPVARVLTKGAEKYPDNNWRKCEDPQVYIGAALRHIAAHQRGELVDPETLESHMAHAACCVLFLVAMMGKAPKASPRPGKGRMPGYTCSFCEIKPGQLFAGGYHGDVMLMRRDPGKGDTATSLDGSVTLVFAPGTWVVPLVEESD